MKNNLSIDERSISIYFEKEFLQILDYDSTPPNGDCIKAIALVRNKEGKPLPNVSVDILEKENSYFGLVSIYHSDKEKLVEIKNISSGQKYFSITSDKNGELIFYIYPKKSTSVIFQVDSMVLDITDRISSKNKVYIVDNNKEDLNLPPLVISEDNSSLLVDPNSNVFNVLIQNYPGAKRNDTILFFINKQYAQKLFFVQEVNKLGNDSYVIFPYNMFKVNELANFSYTVVDKLRTVRSSYPQGIIYPGGGYNQPIDNLTRIYDSCIVYNSYGYHDDKNIIYDTIHEKDVDNKCNNSHHEALFVKIIGTSDYKDKTKVPLGAEVTLNLYVNNYPNTIYQSKVKIMPTQPDSDNSNTATLLFGIPFSYVSHIGNGDIYLDFQVNYYGDISYGKIWQANVYTVRPGGEVTGDACPDGKTWSGIC
ncbi:hypothetical protein [Xenorhabdus ehlersii]|uniref:Uncharacterized protein n=1 Tax=Xenorhabdus ehlersii TaxID=290111 RepID=A0A2D0INS8_9GAMM|nr:hypothetical protein [Xenorhabdus ehlersii]PHM23482.1 hypothetical protein Xehl_02751 [Xenorhabdus ehlersii]RKE90704.1 hypothetical protein BDE27_2599 [Xenorhabdus ehlersii]